MALGKKTGGKNWKPGQSGNPNGRPTKETSLTELMRQFLQDIPDGQDKTYKELFIKKVFKIAIDGDIAAIRLIWNYLDGMPEQKISGEIKIEKPIYGGQSKKNSEADEDKESY